VKRKEIITGLLLIGFLLAVLLPFASESPDGLEKVAAEKGFAAKESESPLAAPLADYRVPGINNKTLSGVISGIAGALAMFSIVGGIAALLKRRRSR
jgi:hypothetical protein